jgi:hypothetical protein
MGDTGVLFAQPQKTCAASKTAATGKKWHFIFSSYLFIKVLNSVIEPLNRLILGICLIIILEDDYGTLPTIFLYPLAQQGS